MDKEGQSIQFSSDKISEKKKPDFFIASNEKAERRKRFSFGTFLGKIGIFFKRFGAKFVDYVKHPIRGKHKILTISLFCIVIAVIVLVALNVTIWQKTTKDVSPLSDEENEAWGIEIAAIVDEGSQLSDEDFRTYYSNLINDQKREVKVIDLSIRYADELSKRGYVDLSLELLNALDKDSMECYQVMNYYEAYALANLMLANGTINSDVTYYNDLASIQETFCLTGELPETEEPQESDEDIIENPEGSEGENVE